MVDSVEVVGLADKAQIDYRSRLVVPREERLIVALDVADPAEARALVELLGDSVSFYKVGMELFMAGGYFELIDWLGERERKPI